MFRSAPTTEGKFTLSPKQGFSSNWIIRLALVTHIGNYHIEYSSFDSVYPTNSKRDRNLPTLMDWLTLFTAISSPDVPVLGRVSIVF